MVAKDCVYKRSFVRGNWTQPPLDNKVIYCEILFAFLSKDDHK